MTEQKKQILLIRHGETVTNTTDVFQAGDQFENDPLTPHGLQQASLLANLFAEQSYKPDIIVSSSYLRARQTAELIAKVIGSHIVVPVFADGEVADMAIDNPELQQHDSLFREHDESSELEGRPFKDEAALAIKDEVHEHLYDPKWHYSDEENLADIWNRAGECLEYLRARPEQTIAVVAHGGIFKAMLARIEFADLEHWTLRQKLEAYQARNKRMWTDNTGYKPVTYSDDEGWKIIDAFNAHLPGIQFGFMQSETKVDSAKEHD